MEENRTPQPLLWERALAVLGRKCAQYKAAVLTALLTGALAYMFAITNKLINHDEVHLLFEKGGTFNLGRWGLAALDSIFPNYSMPWIYGVISIVLVTGVICLMLEIFRVRSKLLQCLVAGTVMVFPTLIGTMAYMFTVSSYALAFLLAVAAVYLLGDGRRLYALAALGAMILSLSIYQSYVAVTASLLVLALIQRLLEGEREEKVFRLGVWYVAFLALSLGSYYCATLVINRLVGVSFGGYAQDNMSFDLVSLPGDILLAYQSFFRYLNEGFRGLVYTPLSRAAHCLILAASVLLLIFWCREKKPGKLRLGLLAAMIALLPLTISCMYLFSAADSVHTLTLYSFVSIYLLAAILADRYLSGEQSRKNWGRPVVLEALTMAMAVVIAVNVYVANAVYLNLYLRAENATAFYTSLVAQLKLEPEYDQDTKLALVGGYRVPEFYFEQFPNIDSITGTTGFFPDNYSRGRFLEYYLGVRLPMASDAQTQAVAAMPEVEQMPCYPYAGCTKMIGDLFVVKLS